jgi:PAS domain S-box-containing protein
LSGKNQIVISKVVDSPELKKPVLKFYLASYSYFENQFQGAACVSVPIESLRDEMRQFDLAQKFNFMLIDSKGGILCDSQDVKTGGKITISDIKSGKLIGQEQLLQKKFLRVNFGGVDSFIFVMPAWIHDWAMCVYLSYEDFMSAPAVLGKINGIISFIILFLSISMSILLAKYLTVPIMELLKGTSAIANGNFTQQVHIQTHDEIRLLSEAFNKMSVNLQTTMVSKDYIDSIIEGMLETLVVLNEGARIKSVNAALCRLLGYNKEELVGQDINFITGDIDIISKMIDNSKTSGVLKLENYEINYYSKDGARIPVVLSCSEIVDKKNNEINYIITASDTRRQKQAELALRDAYNQLKTLQSQLLQAEKMGAIGQLAGGVAHEINNPLTGVLNNVQLIKMIALEKKGSNIDEYKDMLDSIEESAFRCKRIVASLLEFSRVSNGAFQNMSINTVINKAGHLIGEDIKLQNIALKLELQPDIPDIQGDFQLLEQSIIDIVSNAKWAVEKKFHIKPGGRITLRSEYLLGNGYVDLYIMDNGVGISEKEISRIFEPFFTVKEVGEGTGYNTSLNSDHWLRCKNRL